MTKTDPANDQEPMRDDEAILEISRRLEISTVTVIINLPYLKGVNRLKKRSKNAIRCDRYRRKRQEQTGEKL